MDSLEEAVKEIWVWQYSNMNSFYSRLISLYQIADRENRKHIGKAYPHLSLAFFLWEKDDKALFRQYELN